MGLLDVSGEGALVMPPDLRFTGEGKALAKLRLAFNDRKRDPATGAWMDGDSSYLTFTVFGKQAEFICESLTVGDRVVVKGRLKMTEYEKDGVPRQGYEVLVDSIGPAVTFGPAVTERTREDTPTARPKATPVDVDPWSTPDGPAPF